MGLLANIRLPLIYFVAPGQRDAAPVDRGPLFKKIFAYRTLADRGDAFACERPAMIDGKVTKE